MRKKEHWSEDKKEPLIQRIFGFIFGTFLCLAALAIGIIAIAIATTILVKGTEAAWVSIKEWCHMIFG